MGTQWKHNGSTIDTQWKHYGNTMDTQWVYGICYNCDKSRYLRIWGYIYWYTRVYIRDSMFINVSIRIRRYINIYIHTCKRTYHKQFYVHVRKTTLNDAHIRTCTDICSNLKYLREFTKLEHNLR